MRSETIKVLEQALKVLRCLASDARGYSLTELSEKLSMTKSTARRFLITLESQGFAQRHADTDRYSLGLTVLQLSSRLQRNSSLVAIAQPVLEQFSDRTGETAGLHVLFGGRRVCLTQAESRQPVRYVYEVGRPERLYAGAESKVLLAYHSASARDVVRRASDGKLPPRGAKPTLRRELERVRLRGYAISVDELGRGAAAVAAPVHDREGRCVAVLGIVGPLLRMDRRRLSELAPMVREAADAVSRQLGYL